MNTYYKNHLQDYCQSNGNPLPSYRIKKQSGPPHIRKFQVEVEVNGRYYTGHDNCSSKKEAEQSAAKKALSKLAPRDSRRLSTPVSGQQQFPTALRVKRQLIKHFPDEYAHVEQFIHNMIEQNGGQIKNIWTPRNFGRYKVEITGSYRYCDNIKKSHKKSQIYFLVDPVKKIYYQKCSNPKCLGFRSCRKPIIDEQDSDIEERDNKDGKYHNSEKPMKHKKLKKCKYCKKKFSKKYGRKCKICGNVIGAKRGDD